MLATGFLSYTGPFNQEFRLLLMDTWKKELKERSIPYTESINLIEMLTEPAQVFIYLFFCLCYYFDVNVY